MEYFFILLLRIFGGLIFLAAGTLAVAVASVVWVGCHLVEFLSPIPKR